MSLSSRFNCTISSTVPRYDNINVYKHQQYQHTAMSTGSCVPRTSIMTKDMKNGSKSNGGSPSEMEDNANESGNESERSASNSTDESDSDDSSEMDYEENERKRKMCLEHILFLEKKFLGLREQLYRERIVEVESKLNEVELGQAKEYLLPLQKLQDNMRIRTEVAAILRQYKLNNVQNQYNAEEQATRQNLENEKSLLYDHMKEELEEKIRRLEEDRNSVDINADLWFFEHNKRGSNQNPLSSKRGPKGFNRMKSRRKAVTVSGPYIVYMLRDEEIIEDWTIIKKAMSPLASFSTQGY
ncbi:hypothetical protein M8J76_006195 [Diaphorina citri]|nr:hypothetical protein M8J76_006195 [Diaphorina citri]